MEYKADLHSCLTPGIRKSCENGASHTTSIRIIRPRKFAPSRTGIGLGAVTIALKWRSRERKFIPKTPHMTSAALNALEMRSAVIFLQKHRLSCKGTSHV